MIEVNLMHTDTSELIHDDVCPPPLPRPKKNSQNTCIRVTRTFGISKLVR